MRIIGGHLKGRIVNVYGKLPARPTTDMAREALFNILHHNYSVQDAEVLDLFAGTGAMSIEFSSQGAAEVTGIEKNRRCVASIQRNLKELNVENVKIFPYDALAFLKKNRHPYDIVFADPPYDMDQLDQLPDIICTAHVLKPGAVFILEHPPEINFKQHAYFKDHRSYGRVNFSIFELT